MADIVLKDESYQIVGACFEVHNEMGAGFLEAVYQECLEYELGLRGVSFCAKRELELRYKERLLEQKYVPDFVCFGQVIVEIKAVRELTDEHRAQVHNYLRATGFKLGLLVNFGSHPKAQIERIVN